MSKPLIHTAKCLAAHLGQWAIEPTFLRQAVAAIKGGAVQIGSAEVRAPRSAIVSSATPVIDPATAGSDYPETMYLLSDKGAAIIELTGAMMKGRSKFGGVSTVDQRGYLRHAVQNKDVGAILYVMDSPGGTVSGTQSFADEIRAADAIKPVIGHIEDLCASAMFWTGSQMRRLTANRSAMVGSLGTYGVIEDSSKKAEMEGIKVHVLAAEGGTPHKGAFVDGSEVTTEQLAEYQALINKLNALFKASVQAGRRLTADETTKLFDGRVHVAADALELKLIDGIGTLDQALATAEAMVPRPSPDNARRLRMAKAQG